jgi:8-oxo-dGTP pyrophosphatase MutT (NUDIX family)
MAEPAKPVPASTLLLVRDGEAGLEVLLLTRHAASGFAAGALVFPGGKIDLADEGLFPGEPPSHPSPAFWVGAIRETFEECGVLLARRGGKLLDAAEVAALPREAAHDASAFSRLLGSEKLELATDLLVPFAHWITPPDSPKRFDTHFFVAPVPPDQRPAPDGHETTGLLWTSPHELVEAAKAGRANLVFATRLNLLKLGRSRTAAEALEAARRSKIVTVSPEFIEKPEGKFLRIPEEAGYGGSEFSAAGIQRAWKPS